ncbi:MAG: acyltransferase, partial [Pseudomonadota bacterium]|nr:acyltransferase [Pseudomonadota bacterium]
MQNWNQLSNLSRPRLHALDGIRGLCAIAIMLYHILLWNGVALFQIGTFGVYLFYVLSGFSLWYVYAHRAVTFDLLKTFFTARVARIVPLYLAVCLLIVVLRFYTAGASNVFNADFISRFLLNITFLFGVALPQKSSIVPGGWSIGVEWVFYLSFPL